MATLSGAALTVTQQQRRLVEVEGLIKVNDDEMKAQRERRDDAETALRKAVAASYRLANEKEDLERAISESKILVIKSALLQTAARKPVA